MLPGKKMVGEADIRLYLDRFDKKYWATYKVPTRLGCVSDQGPITDCPVAGLTPHCCRCVSSLVGHTASCHAHAG